MLLYETSGDKILPYLTSKYPRLVILPLVTTSNTNTSGTIWYMILQLLFHIIAQFCIIVWTNNTESNFLTVVLFTISFVAWLFSTLHSGCASGCSLLTHWGDTDSLDHITGDIFAIWFASLINQSWWWRRCWYIVQIG